MYALARRTLLPLFLLVVASAACGASAGAGSSVNVTTDDTGRTILLDPGDELNVSLDSNGSTGFTWVLTTEPDARVLKLIGSEYLGPDTELLGAPGQEVWTFRAEREGETSLVLGYQRSGGEATGQPFELTVRIR